MELIIRIGQLLLSLSLLVLLHELGHFTAAKFFKTRVDKFYLFFNPWFSLFKTKRGETEYGIGWLPIGGYVKIAGMIDESMDKEQMKLPPKPDEFRSKKTWQRLIIILGGVIVNFVLAYFIYVGISYKWGESYLPNDSLKYGVVVDDIAYNIGLRNGDKILTIDGEKTEHFSQIVTDLVMNKPQQMTILRSKDTLRIAIPDSFQKEILAASSKSFDMKPLLQPRILFSPFDIGAVREGSPAQKAGLQKGDEILTIEGKRFQYYDEFQRFIAEYKNSILTLVIKRGEETKQLEIAIEDKAVLGVYVDRTRHESFAFKQRSYSLAESFAKAWERFAGAIQMQLSSLKLLTTKEGVGAVGGIGAMSQIFPTFWNWQSFWSITAMLSIMLGVLNLLPIPGLDGGHAIFILYEMVTGRKPNQRFMEVVHTIGVLFLIGLIILVNMNDLFKFMN